MNWFKNLFKTDQLSKDIGKVILPDMKYDFRPKPEKDISEPVLSFVECVRKNPKRFKVNSYYEQFYLSVSSMGGEYRPTYLYTLVDTKTKEKWCLSRGLTMASDFTANPEWITNDERNYLIESLTKIFKDREGRKSKLEKIRKDRRIRDERNRLKEIYK